MVWMEGRDSFEILRGWYPGLVCVCARASCLDSLLSISIDSGQGASPLMHVCTDGVERQEEGEPAK